MKTIEDDQLIAEGTRRYLCERCGRAFSTEGALTQHWQTDCNARAGSLAEITRDLAQLRRWWRRHLGIGEYDTSDSEPR